MDGVLVEGISVPPDLDGHADTGEVAAAVDASPE